MNLNPIPGRDHKGLEGNAILGRTPVLSRIGGRTPRNTGYFWKVQEGFLLGVEQPGDDGDETSADGS